MSKNHSFDDNRHHNDDNSPFHPEFVPEYSACQKALDQAKDAFTNANFTKAFDFSNAAVHAIRKQHIDALSLRAATLAKMARFKAATADAEMIININPTSPEGYLCYGNLLEVRGNHRQAVRIYKKGIQLMKTNEFRSILEQQCDVAIAKSNERVDIISRFPYDITNTILMYLGIEQRFILLDVSKLWRTIVSECASAWSKLILCKHTKLSTSIAKSAALIGIISKHVKDLTLMDFKNASLFESVLTQMTDGCFSKLEAIFISNCLISSTKRFFDALSGVTSTLKHIILSVNYKDIKKSLVVEIPLNTLLMTCPNMKTLNQYFPNSVTFEEVKGYHYYESASYVTNALTSLQLDFNHITIADLKWIYDTCPRLRRLIICGCRSILLNVIHHLFEKKLDRLCFGINLYEVFDDGNVNVGDKAVVIKSTQILPTHSNTSLSSTGMLREVALKVDNPYNFISLFSNNYTTIRTLRLVIDTSWYLTDIDEKEAKEGWQSLLSNIPNLNNLRLLDVCAADQTICSTIVAPLLEKSPNLRCLESYTPSKLVGSKVITAIINLRHLQKLVISECTSNDQDIQTLFRSLAAKGTNESTLEHVSIIYNDDFSVDGIIEYLASISTLRHIMFDAVDGLSKKGMTLLCEKLQEHSCIRTIKLCYLDDCIDDTILHCLANIKRLENLFLTGLNKITHSGLNAFTGTLVKLTIESCRNIK
ncbi:hypothetical protein BDC45DRAFT_531850 [Circinella umbellata]|nr:hypothetical protein BDC45DRAFT_531850 [Circinella umbellata]